MMVVALTLWAASATADQAWTARAVLAADRLAVAAVGPDARTRPLKDLWWSGEGQQVLEMMDHRACVGSPVAGCLHGGPVPAHRAQAAKAVYEGRMRWSWSSPRWQINAFEIVGTEAVLWTWRPVEAAAVMPPVVAPQEKPKVASADQPWPVWFWFALVGVGLGLFVTGRRWGRRRLVRQIEVWQGSVERLEEDLEQERLRHAVTQGHHERLEEAWRTAVAQSSEADRQVDLRQIQALEDRLDRLRKQWSHMRQSWSVEVEVRQRDAHQFLAPLQQLDGLFLQIERRMNALGEVEFARLMQNRRLGLQAFTARWRRHFEGAVTLDESSWARSLEGLDELLQLGHGMDSPPRSTTQDDAFADLKQRLFVVRGGR